MAYWLFKSEPETWSWDDQVKKGKAGQEWDGVRNFTARNNMRAMKMGDRGFFYHSGDDKAVVGIVEVVREAHPDSTDSEGRWECVDIAAVRAAAQAGDAGRRQGRQGACRDGAGQAVPPLGPAGQRSRVEAGVQAGRTIETGSIN